MDSDTRIRIRNSMIRDDSRHVVKKIVKGDVLYRLAQINSGDNTGLMYWETEFEFCRKNIKDTGTINIVLNIPKEISGQPVASLAQMFMSDSDKANIFENRDIVIDMTKSDLSNIILTDYMLSDFRHSKSVTLLLPDGERKLAPSSISYMFEDVHVINMDDVLKRISFANVVRAIGLFFGSSITSFDFNHTGSIEVCDGKVDINLSSMFENCGNLKSVHGRVMKGSSGIKVSASDMFYCCCELEDLEDSLFEGIIFKDMARIFNQCSQVVDPKIRGCNFSDNIDYRFIDCKDAFGGCNKLDISKVSEVLKIVSKHGGTRGIFDGCLLDIVHGEQIELWDGHAVFSGIKSEILDLSGVTVHKQKDGLLGMLDKETFLHRYEKTYGFKANTKSELLEIRCIPHIIIINDTIKLSDRDRELFEVIDCRSFSHDEVWAKINMARLLGMGRIVVIVRSETYK